MKHLFNVKRNLLLLSMLFLLTACPYTSMVPIEGKEIYDSNLIGKWMLCKDGEILKGQSENYYVFEKYKENGFQISSYSWVESEKKIIKTDTYNAFIVKVNNQEYLNVIVESVGYCYFKIERKDKNNVIFHQLSDEIEEVFNTSNELRKFLEKNAKNELIFNEKIFLRKV